MFPKKVRVSWTLEYYQHIKSRTKSSQKSSLLISQGVLFWALIRWTIDGGDAPQFFFAHAFEPKGGWFWPVCECINPANACPSSLESLRLLSHSDSDSKKET